MHIRRTLYWRHGQPITLAYVSGIDAHPEVTGDAPPPAPTAPPAKLPFERAPRWSETAVRRAMGRDPRQTARLLNWVGFQATLRRIEKQGF